MNLKQSFSVCILITFLVMNTQAKFLPNRPDAIRCGTGADKGALFFAHSVSSDGISRYDQIYAGEQRYVAFNSDGSFNSGKGHYASRSGCQFKSLQQLQSWGRTYILSQQMSDWQMKQQWSKDFKTMVADENAKLEKIWYEQFQQRLLNEISTNGLQIGSRWKIQQESTAFVIRDIQGSKTQDARILFPANTSLNPS